MKITLSSTTIPYEITVKYGAAKVLLKPASPVLVSSPVAVSGQLLKLPE